jgi:CheY-like chemotaxis protein
MLGCDRLEDSEEQEEREDRNAGGRLEVEGRRHPSVLVVDDDAGNLAALREALDAEGIAVLGTATGGEAAVERAADLRPDVILMDLRMPDMDGFVATAAIHEEHPWIQVVILTAYEELLTDSAESVGAFAYLVKGCSTDLMREVIVQAGRRSAELRRRAAGV